VGASAFYRRPISIGSIILCRILISPVSPILSGFSINFLVELLFCFMFVAFLAWLWFWVKSVFCRSLLFARRGPSVMQLDLQWSKS
jgi:hypothetical protein